MSLTSKGQCHTVQIISKFSSTLCKKLLFECVSLQRRKEGNCTLLLRDFLILSQSPPNTCYGCFSVLTVTVRILFREKYIKSIQLEKYDQVVGLSVRWLQRSHRTIHMVLTGSFLCASLNQLEGSKSGTAFSGYFDECSVFCQSERTWEISCVHGEDCSGATLRDVSVSHLVITQLHSENSLSQEFQGEDIPNQWWCN